ncbi:hypothetical protein ACFLZI_02010 [Nitrospirota bacterium]
MVVRCCYKMKALFVYVPSRKGDNAMIISLGPLAVVNIMAAEDVETSFLEIRPGARFGKRCGSIS